MKNLIPNIPITKITEKSVILPSVFICKSATIVNFEEEEYFVSGYGFDKEESIAELKSRNELYERLFALEALHNDTIFSSFSITERDKFIKQSKEEILLIRGNALSASGLSCHQNYEKAVQHACLELLERHYCASLWYGESTYITPINVRIDKYGNEITSYILVCEHNIPFVVTSIFNSSEEVFILGTAFKLSIKEAVEHSELEAYMLYENIHRGNLGMASNKKVVDRIRSLKGEYSMYRHLHLKNRVLPKSVNNTLYDNYCFEQILNVIKYCKFQIFITELYLSEDYYIVRANSNSLLTLPKIRNIKIDMVNDPYC